MTEYLPAPELQRLSNEPARWFERFVRFVMLPPERRSLLAVYRIEVEEAQTGPFRPEKSGLQLPGAWKRAAREWQWKARAAAHDQQQHALRLAELSQARAVMIERHIKIALQMQARAVDWLQEHANKLETPRDVVLFIKIGVDLERSARGLSTKLIDFQNLSDDELLTRYDTLLRSLRDVEEDVSTRSGSE